MEKRWLGQVDGIDNDQVKGLIKITKIRKMMDLPIFIGHEDVILLWLQNEKLSTTLIG